MSSNLPAGLNSLPAARCVLISSYGKSGSKRLLRLFDLNPETHCRNEPDEYKNSPFNKLRQIPESWIVCRGDNEKIASHWSGAVKWAASHIGNRDQFPPPHKLASTPIASFAWRIIGSQRCRMALGFVAPEWRSEEWIPSGWLYNADKMRAAVAVFKLNHAPELTTWALQNDPTTRVIHLLRHPAAVLNSWRKRFLAISNREIVTHNNRSRLRFIMQHEPQWHHRFETVEKMSAEESELWYWCYLNEAINEIGANYPSYKVVLDEDIASNTPEIVSKMMRHCDLPISQAMINVTAKVSNEWRNELRDWHQLLDKNHINLVNRILAESPLSRHWSPNELVSGIDYKWKQLGL